MSFYLFHVLAISVNSLLCPIYSYTDDGHQLRHQNTVTGAAVYLQPTPHETHTTASGTIPNTATSPAVYLQHTRRENMMSSVFYKSHAAMPMLSSSESCTRLLDQDFELSGSDLAVLTNKEETFGALHSIIEAIDAPLVRLEHFGRSSRDEEVHLFPLELQRTIAEGKEEYGIAEFDLASLIEGGIKSRTPEAYFCCNDHAREDMWEVACCLDWADTEFEDVAFLRHLLTREGPLLPVHMGRMIRNYWRRRGHSLSSLVAEHFRKERQYFVEKELDWLSDNQVEVHIDLETRCGEHGPLDETLDLDNPELGLLGEILVNYHPVHDNGKALIRAYESWEPSEPFGEEVFPDCGEGREAYECLRDYQNDEWPPAYLEDCERREEEERMRKERRDSVF
ncbi:hypothetical protein EK21DRAFT_83514 [Setomelanomma holmii]|uniref:Uncharacterized protein n=1 Tax=Setomelanomma holmii TaxID=210430 RepID=A0A9P4LU83_9PLEO|nr:hypothetical protein EK21DRAFT_83514 [Setomelanomma holmii]